MNDRSADSSRPVLSRDQLLRGLPERRTSTLLYAIENRTAQLVARSRRAMLTDLTERSAADQERAFLAALAGGREARATPSVQDLERYADRWQGLVPADPPLRAALARQAMTKYAVPKRARRMRQALGLDDPEVVAAYARSYGEPLENAFAKRISAVERLRWVRSRFADRLERLPPFWTAFALTLTETVGAGVLALPIALAGFGPLGAVGLLVVFGLINVITVAALCESITRNGHMRFGSAYFGRLVFDFLGRPGLWVLSVALGVLQAVVLLVGLTGFGDVLGGATGVHPGLWAAGLFAVALLVLGRGSLDATIASAIVIGTVNLVVLALIATVTIGAAGWEVLALDPDELRAEPVTLALAFGVLLASYFGHVSAGNAAKVVLRRDPGGRSLLWGNVAAMATVIVVYAVLITAIFGVLDEMVLIGHQGTVITPLAEAVGPSIYLLGAIYATLALGIGTLYGALGLYNMAGEALDPVARRFGRGVQSVVRRPSARFLLRVTPAFVVFLLFEALVLTGRASFTGPISVLGTLAVPLLAGVFPVLMVAAARRRGDRIPAVVLGFVGRRPVLSVIWVLFVTGVMAHALIWPTIVERLIAAAAALGIIILTVIIVRSGALRPVASLEIRYEAGSRDPEIFVISGDRPLPAVVTRSSLDELRVELPRLEAPELRIWAHQIADDEVSAGLDVEVRGPIRGPNDEAAMRLGPDGETTVPVREEPLSLVFTRLRPALGRAEPPRP